MGFTAIWISPIAENIEGNDVVGEPYHGFWTKDITEVNQHFGTKDDLKALSKALHDRGMVRHHQPLIKQILYAEC